MYDITKCEGTDCWIKDKCIRFTSEAYDLQPYFISPPFELTEEQFSCEFFENDDTMDIWNQLKNIVGE